MLKVEIWTQATQLDLANARTPKRKNISRGNENSFLPTSSAHQNLQQKFSNAKNNNNQNAHKNPGTHMTLTVPFLPPTLPLMADCTTTGTDEWAALTNTVPEGPWHCECGYVLPPDRQRCKCQRWQGGKQAKFERSKMNGSVIPNNSETSCNHLHQKMQLINLHQQ